MQDARWHVRAITGLDPDAAPHTSRLVIVAARYDSADVDGHVATHEFEIWIPAELTDLSTIERVAYRELRTQL